MDLTASAMPLNPSVYPVDDINDKCTGNRTDSSCILIGGVLISVPLSGGKETCPGFFFLLINSWRASDASAIPLKSINVSFQNEYYYIKSGSNDNGPEQLA